jgi:diamine N-acetyltransferase
MIPFIVSDQDLEREKQWVGYVALSHVDPIADKAECSYVIHPSHRGKGYGIEAIFQILYYGFFILGLQKIYSDTFEYNGEEVEINKSCGFTVDGYLPRHYFKRGKFLGSIPMSILRENFEAKWSDKLSKIKYAGSKPL